MSNLLAKAKNVIKRATGIFLGVISTLLGISAAIAFCFLLVYLMNLLATALK